MRVICKQCGKEFKTRPCYQKRGGAKFCSPECGYENKRRRSIVKCEVCGKEFKRRTYELERRKGRRIFCSKACTGKWISANLSGENSYQHGREFSYETRKKMGDACRGEKNYNWKGGIKSENEQIRRRMDYKEWRTAVFERDNYTCQLCGQRGGLYLEAHHILGFADYPEYRFEVDNGITECKECHHLLLGIEKVGDIFQPLPAYI